MHKKIIKLQEKLKTKKQFKNPKHTQKHKTTTKKHKKHTNTQNNNTTTQKKQRKNTKKTFEHTQNITKKAYVPNIQTKAHMLKIQAPAL